VARRSASCLISRRTAASTNTIASSSSNFCPSGLAALSFSHFSDSGVTLISVGGRRFRALFDFFSVIVSVPWRYAASFSLGLSPARDARRTNISKLNCPILPRLMSDTRAGVMRNVLAA
jgi:hypothetical protein